MSPSGGPRRSAGFTLVEVVVAVAVLAVAFMLAAQLVVECLRLLGRSGAALRDPQLTRARVVLRHDLHDAARVSGIPVWTEADLHIQRADGGRVRIGVEDGRLVRTGFGGTEGDTTRVLLPRLAGFRWRLAADRLVEVELAVAGHPLRWEPVPDRGPRRSVSRLTVALRGAEGGRWW